MATRKDYYMVTFLGAGFGLLLIPILQNIQPDFWRLSLVNAVGLALFFAVFANLALRLAEFAGHAWPVLWQFAKFSAVGSFNALLDIGTLNFLSFIFKIYQGPALILFNSISFSIAITNSYFLNKFWSFKSVTPVGWREYAKFVAAMFGGLVINTAIVYFLTLKTPAGFSLPVWENIAKLIAVAPALVWNFFALHLYVFKKPVKS